MTIQPKRIVETEGIVRTIPPFDCESEWRSAVRNLFLMEMALEVFARFYVAKYQGQDTPLYTVVAKTEDNHYIRVGDLKRAYDVCQERGYNPVYFKPGVTYEIDPDDLLDYGLIAEWSKS